MKDSLRTIIFATVLGAVCAGLLAGASQLLKPLQQENIAAEKSRNVYSVLGVAVSPGAAASELLKLQRSKDNPDAPVGKLEVAGMTIFTYRHPEAGELYAVECSGQGLWGPIEGLLCLKADLKTIHSIAFYKQDETPGLGAEISLPSFTGLFRGKTIAGPGAPGVRVRKPGAATGNNEIDGISGATLTCDKVDALVNRISVRVLENREAILKASAAPGGPGGQGGGK